MITLPERVLIRADLNVPMHEGKILNTARLRACLPTILPLVQQGKAVTLISHLGRPKGYDPALCMRPIVAWFQSETNLPIIFLEHWPNEVHVQGGTLAIADNLRFLPGEKNCDPGLISQMAATCDRFIFDAFATAHRHHASTFGLIQACDRIEAGPLLCKEIAALDHLCKTPIAPTLAIIGGGKIETKGRLIETLLPNIDDLCLGGGLANTALLAEGYEIGRSYANSQEQETYLHLKAAAKKHGVKIHLPCDANGAEDLDHPSQTMPTDAWQADFAMYDLGPKTIAHYQTLIAKARTILWAGPMGVYEHPNYRTGSVAMADAIGHSKAHRVIGGGDTVAVLDYSHVTDKNFTHISTGGGAFLAYFSGLKLLSYLPNLRDDHATTTH